MNQHSQWKGKRGNASRHQWIENPLHQSPQMTLCLEVTRHWRPLNWSSATRSSHLWWADLWWFGMRDMCGCHNHGNKDKCGSSPRRTSHAVGDLWNHCALFTRPITHNEFIRSTNTTNIPWRHTVSSMIQKKERHMVWHGTQNCWWPSMGEMAALQWQHPQSQRRLSMRRGLDTRQKWDNTAAPTHWLKWQQTQWLWNTLDCGWPLRDGLTRLTLTMTKCLAPSHHTHIHTIQPPNRPPFHPSSLSNSNPLPSAHSTTLITTSPFAHCVRAALTTSCTAPCSYHLIEEKIWLFQQWPLVFLEFLNTIRIVVYVIQFTP